MTATLIRTLKAMLPRAVSDAIFRAFLRRRVLKRVIAAYPSREVTHVYGGVRLRVSLEDPTAEAWYDWDWPVLPEIAELQQRGLRPDALVFNLGAHQGIVALVLASIVGEHGRVVAVEPEPHNARVARRNLVLNDVENVCVIEAAVTARPGTVKFEEGLGGRIVDKAPGNIDVDATTIDDLAAEFGEPDVLFVDVEGAEADALVGARRTLARGQATWFVEVHQGLGLELRGGGGADVLAEFPSDRFEVLVAVENEDRTQRFEAPSGSFPDGRFFLIASPVERVGG